MRVAPENAQRVLLNSETSCKSCRIRRTINVHGAPDECTVLQEPSLQKDGSRMQSFIVYYRWWPFFISRFLHLRKQEDSSSPDDDEEHSPPPLTTSSPASRQQRTAKVSLGTRSVAQLVTGPGERAFYLHDYRGPDDHLAKLLHAFGQKKVVGWKGLPSDLFVNVQKLGEGTYGEVFKTTYRGQQVAVKVTPITNHDGGFMGKVNGEALKDASLVIPEFVITQELSRLAQGTRNKTNTFIGLHEARVVRGCYPGEFLDAWDRFKAVKNTENVRPDQYADKDQLFVTMALDVSGADLDSYKIKSVEEATSILLQTIWALMAAEKELKFEHRDLHAGNVLLQKTDEEHISFRVDDVPHSVRSHGVRVRIIDFTLSRMEKGTTKIFLDPSGIVELFSGRDDYQFDVYRLMRAHNKNNWQTFCPSRICCGFTTYVTCRKRTLKKQRQQLQEVFDRVLQYDSLEHFVSEDTAFIDTVKNGYVIEE